MKRFLALTLLIGGATIGLVGCDQKSEVKEEKVTTTPGGGKVTETDSHKVDKSGDAKDPSK